MDATSIPNENETKQTMSPKRDIIVLNKHEYLRCRSFKIVAKHNMLISDVETLFFTNKQTNKHASYKLLSEK